MKVDKKRYQHPSQLSWYERLGEDENSNEEPSEIENMEVDDQDLLEDFYPIFYGRGKKMLPLQSMGKRMLPLQNMVGKRDDENDLYPMRFKKKFIHPIASYLEKKSGREMPAWYKDRLADLGKEVAAKDLWWFRGAPGI